ncbi:dynein heavy chain and region D6 of dynein motor-domain-containing protein [Pavlovales sp. CCMP2436]|nr:dynein heavy chain and region D6 of dynein motor-domain-containing protein [Pavlovales sp. CCMP2436]
MRRHNETHARMELVLFEDAIEHVCRSATAQHFASISRILDRPRGNAMLLGVGGSGRQSLTRLAAFIGGFELVQISLTSAYGLPDFKADLLSLYARAGLRGESVVLLITDRQIVDERMLMYLSDCLSSGYIPDLYAPEEKDSIVNAVRNEVKAAGLLDSRQNCWDFFIDKVRANLHFVLCFSPVGDAFRVRCRKFPALTHCCTIDYFRPFLADADLGADEVRENLAHHMAYVHKCVSQQAALYSAQERRPTYTTPKSFLELVSTYKSQLAKARGSVDAQMQRLEQGLLREEQVVVEQKKGETDGLLVQVGQESAIADEQAQVAEAEERQVAKIQSEVAAFEAQCAADLAAAEPAIKKAEAALEVLDKKALTELKSLANPPKDVVAVCQAVMYLTAKPKTNLKKLDSSWNGVRKAMGSAFDRDSIPPENKEMVRRYTGPPDRPDPTFNGDVMKSKSVAAAGLCDWVCNMVTYHDMYIVIEPKRNLLAEAQTKMDDANRKLASVREHVSALEERKTVLQEQLVLATEEKNRLLDAAQRTAKRLDLAERLVNGLKDENERWGSQVELLKEHKALLVGNIMVAASFIAYIGPFNEAFRRRLVVEQWVPDVLSRDIPMTTYENGKALDPVSILADAAQVAQWKLEGLPSDRLSIENGAIISACARWPLLIDPQLQGVAWIKRHEESNGLAVTQLSHRAYIEHVRRAMEDGTAVLIENVAETLDAVLEPVLARATMRKGRKTVICVGEREVDVLTAPGGGVGGGSGGVGVDVPLFRLYLQTKLSTPHFSPEIQAQTTLINFSVTAAGLQDQLLAVVVNRERPELEEARAIMAVQQNNFTVNLKELEDDLLFRLANAEGDVLADEVLIESLEATKVTVREVEVKAAEAQLTAAEIDKARETFRPVATRASLIYFLIDSLSAISPMYQFSLGLYNAVFHRALDLVEAGAEEHAETEDAEEGSDKEDTGSVGGKSANSGKAGRAGEGDGGEDGPARIAKLVDSVTYTTFTFVTRGLFERHRLIYAAKLAMDALRSTGDLSADDVDLLVRPSKVTDQQNLLGQWLSDAAWESCMYLAEAKPSVYASLPQDMDGSWKRWKEWIDAETPELVALPQEWKKLSSFHRLVLIRALRPDRMHPAVEMWVREALGARYGVALPFDLERSFTDASPAVPIFFLLSPGVDPTRAVRALADAHQLADGLLITVSLGEGQEVVAEKVLDRMHVEGGWAMLQNVELVPKWLPTLERKLKALAQGAHANFRIFLTAMPGGAVPGAILQFSIKLTNEPPSGLKANMLRALNIVDDSLWDNHSRKPELKAVVFALCFFHSVVCERRKFGPIGWNWPYPFSLSDLSVCVSSASSYLESAHAADHKVPWEELRYIFGEIIYGGHITDNWDRRLCAAYLDAFLCEELLAQEGGVPLASSLFVSPPPSLEHRAFLAYAEEHLEEAETPAAYGLHPNSEVIELTRRTATLFDAIAELQPRASTGSGGMSLQEKAKRQLDDVLERLPAPFVMTDVEERMPAEDGASPFSNVLLQECARMNALLREMRRSLDELDRGLKARAPRARPPSRLGAAQPALSLAQSSPSPAYTDTARAQGELSISEDMEKLVANLYDNRVPPSWETAAWPSLRPLGTCESRLQSRLHCARARASQPTWLGNMLERQAQLSEWTVELLVPRVTWISGLFNPQAYLTAVMQATARKSDWPLDKFAIMVEVTNKSRDEIEGPMREGALVYGLYLEGARWDLAGGVLEDATLKELHPTMPVLLVKAVPHDKLELRDFYQCPVYQTQQRGPTFVFTAGLRTKVPPAKWVLAGVAMLMDMAM